MVALVRKNNWHREIGKGELSRTAEKVIIVVLIPPLIYNIRKEITYRNKRNGRIKKIVTTIISQWQNDNS